MKDRSLDSRRLRQGTVLGLTWLMLVFSLPESAAAQLREPLRAGWTFTPSITFSGAWDDNVVLVSTEEGRPSDYVTAVIPGGAIDFLSPRLHVSGGYHGSFVFYRELTELNSVDQFARANLQYRANSRTTLSASQTVSSAQTTDGIELVGVPFRRIGNITSVTRGGIDLRVTPRTTVKGGYAFRVVDFDDDAGQFLTFPGGHEHHLSSAVAHQVTTRLSIGGAYDLRRVVVADSPLTGVDGPSPAVEPQEVVLVHQSAATTEYRVAERVTLNGSFGLSHLGEGLTHAARTGLAWRAGISSRHEYFQLAGHYARSVVPSFGFGGTFQNEELVGNIRAPFAGNRGYWQTGLAWRDNDPLIPGPPSTRTIWFSSTAGYVVVPWLRLEGYYSRAHQDTQLAGGQVSRNRVGFQVVTLRPVRVAR
jgi:hypothetical protein